MLHPAEVLLCFASAAVVRSQGLPGCVVQLFSGGALMVCMIGQLATWQHCLGSGADTCAHMCMPHSSLGSSRRCVCCSSWLASLYHFCRRDVTRLLVICTYPPRPSPSWNFAQQWIVSLYPLERAAHPVCVRCTMSLSTCCCGADCMLQSTQRLSRRFCHAALRLLSSSVLLGRDSS